MGNAFEKELKSLQDRNEVDLSRRGISKVSLLLLLLLLLLGRISMTRKGNISPHGIMEGSGS